VYTDNLIHLSRIFLTQVDCESEHSSHLICDRNTQVVVLACVYLCVCVCVLYVSVFVCSMCVCVCVCEREFQTLADCRGRSGKSASAS
jgi:hypothetical protein